MTTKKIEELYRDFQPLLISLAVSACRKHSSVDYSDILSHLSLCFVENVKRYDQEKPEMEFPGYIKMALEKDSIDYLRKKIILDSREIPNAFQSGNTDYFWAGDLRLDDENLLIIDGFEEKLVDTLYLQELLDKLWEYSPEYAEIIIDVFIKGYSCTEPYITEKYGLSVTGAYNRVKAALRDLRRIAEQHERMEEKAHRYNRFIYKKVSPSGPVGVPQSPEGQESRPEETSPAG
jgi:DNA-directed RNA polymerase specialized sigma24 family protein